MPPRNFFPLCLLHLALSLSSDNPPFFSSFRDVHIKEPVITELLQALLPKVNNDNFPHMVEVATTVILSLLTILRSEKHTGPRNVAAADDQSESSELRLPLDQLFLILRTVVNVTLGGTTPTIRKNLYCILLNYLQYTSPPASSIVLDFSQPENQNQLDANQITLDNGNLSIINRDGNKVHNIFILQK